MELNRITGKYKQIKGKVKEQWGYLTDDPFYIITGKREKIEGKIQALYGNTKNKKHMQINNWQ